MARFAPLYNVGILAATAEVRIVIDRRDKLGLDGPGAAAREVRISVMLESPSPKEDVKKLTAHAERACHAASSLAVAVPLSTEVRCNGEALS